MTEQIKKEMENLLAVCHCCLSGVLGESFPIGHLALALQENGMTIAPDKNVLCNRLTI
jgi:hypothetical protein